MFVNFRLRLNFNFMLIIRLGLILVIKQLSWNFTISCFEMLNQKMQFDSMPANKQHHKMLIIGQLDQMLVGNLN